MKMELIIPTHDNDGSDNARVIESAITSFCGLFGGATVYDASGYWTNDAGRLFEDQVKVIVSAAPNGGEATAEDDLRELAQMVLDATDQEAVYMAAGGKVTILE